MTTRIKHCKVLTKIKNVPCYSQDGLTIINIFTSYTRN